MHRVFQVLLTPLHRRLADRKKVTTSTITPVEAAENYLKHCLFTVDTERDYASDFMDRFAF
jgi:hypothetical protein